jgi:hypothetical protein
VWRAAGDREGVALASSLLGIVTSRSGDPQQGALLLADAREHFTLLCHDADVEQADLRIAETRLLAGDPSGAEDLARTMTGAEDPAVAAAAYRLCGLARRDRGDLTAARLELERSRAVAAEHGEEFEHACTLAVLAPLVEQAEPGAGGGLAREAAALLERFGVVRLPAWADPAPLVVA